MTMAEQNEAKRSKQSTIRSKNDNQPDRNDGDLPCDGRQPLSTAAEARTSTPPPPEEGLDEMTNYTTLQVNSILKLLKFLPSAGLPSAGSYY
jgi:hypothetical protein